MSVIVKGMEMPKNCMSCPMFNGIGCKTNMKMFNEFTNVAVRVKDCPLVELPEKHGHCTNNHRSGGIDVMNTMQFIACCVSVGISQERAETYIEQTQQEWYTEEDIRILKEV